METTSNKRVGGWAIALATALTALALPGTAQAQVERSRHFSERTQMALLQAVVRLRVSAPGEKVCRGSAVCIGRDAEGRTYLLTCYHVMKRMWKVGATLTLETFSGASYPNPEEQYRFEQVEIWTEPRWDLALLRVQADVPGAVRLWAGKQPPKKGTALLNVGCGKGAPPICQVGEFVGLDRQKDLLFSRGGIGGRSGGLLYARGGMVGVHARGQEDQSSAIHYAKIRQFLRECGIVGQTPARDPAGSTVQVRIASEKPAAPRGRSIRTGPRSAATPTRSS